MPNGEKVDLRPIDADHFWFGELLVDLVLLWREAQQLSRNRMLGNDHSVVFNLRYLDHVAGCLTRGDTKFLTAKKVADSLLKLNQLGLHTGYTEKS